MVVPIGAFGNNNNGKIDAGHVRVYFWDDSAWIQRRSDIDGDQAAGCVSLSGYGNVVALGAVGYDDVFFEPCALPSIMPSDKPSASSSNMPSTSTTGKPNEPSFPPSGKPSKSPS